MKITNKIGLGFAGAFTALGLLVAAPNPEAKAGGIYWNNNGGGGIVVNRGHYYGPRENYNYGPRGYYNCGPRYYRGRGVAVGPNGACARGYYGRGGCVRY